MRTFSQCKIIFKLSFPLTHPTESAFSSIIIMHALPSRNAKFQMTRLYIFQQTSRRILMTIFIFLSLYQLQFGAMHPYLVHQSIPFQSAQLFLSFAHRYTPSSEDHETNEFPGAVSSTTCSYPMTKIYRYTRSRNDHQT